MTLRGCPRVNSLDYGVKILFRSSLKRYCDFHEAGSGHFTSEFHEILNTIHARHFQYSLLYRLNFNDFFQ